MSTDTEQQAPDAHGSDTAETVVLPTQRRPVEPATRRVDHVRVHGRSCWWDLTEARWQCTPGR